MKKNFAKRMTVTLAITIFIMCFSGFAAGPGTEEDPLVTLSYINSVIMPQFKSYVDYKIADSHEESFKIVELKKGQSVIGFQGTEIILRTGKASVIASKKGGIADVTVGVDLPASSRISANHLLIVPYTDWRGVTMKADGILLVRGLYKIV